MHKSVEYVCVLCLQTQCEVGEREVNKNNSVPLYGQFIGQCRENEMHFTAYVLRICIKFCRCRCMCKYSQKSMQNKLFSESKIRPKLSPVFGFLQFATFTFMRFIKVYECMRACLCGFTVVPSIIQYTQTY